MDRIAEAGFKTGWAADATVWWQLRPGFISTFRKFSLYSKHNVWAGMQRHWHYNIARQYLIWMCCLIFAIVYSWWWLLVPFLGYAARVWKGIWVRREGRGLWWALNPVQFAYVAGILLTIDTAMFVGWGEALLRKR